MSLSEWLVDKFKFEITPEGLHALLGLPIKEIDMLEKCDIEIVMVSYILDKKLYKNNSFNERERNFMVMAKTLFDHFESTLNFNYKLTLRQMWELR